METNKILIMANTNAVDAAIYTKGDAIANYSRIRGIALEKIAGIGDEIIDISFLKTPGLLLAGAPANAQKPVIEKVNSMPNGWVSKKEYLDAFAEFYEYAHSIGATHIVSDRDGVIIPQGDFSRAKDFIELLEKMKRDYPHIAILTGSSYGQNIEFRKAFGLDERLKGNPKVEEDPNILLMENGLVQVNVLTGEQTNLCSILNPDLLHRLKQEFEPEVRNRLERKLGSLGLSFSPSYSDQKGRVYIPDKQGMTTFNIPREFPDGRKDYRKSRDAEILRKSIVDIMYEVAEELNIPYEIVGGE